MLMQGPGGLGGMKLPMPMHMHEHEMIGAIKIKDGLFIGDELASTVSYFLYDDLIPTPSTTASNLLAD